MIGPMTQAAIDDIQRAGMIAYVSETGDEVIVTVRSEWGETQGIKHPWEGIIWADAGIAGMLRFVARSVLTDMLAKVGDIGQTGDDG